MASYKDPNRDSPSRHVTVVDVYDLAAMIGKDFEHLIELYGQDCVKGLMPKVVSSLEMLEAFASRNEQENEEICGLKKTVQLLEAEKRERIEGRDKFERELEKIEENYRSEIKELWNVVEQLQEENKKLAVAVEKNKECPGTPTTPGPLETDIKFWLKMQETVDKQKEQLKEFRHESELRRQEIEQLHGQIERITRINKELLRKNTVVQTQGRLLVEEKSDLISQIQSRDRVVEQLREKLGHAERAFKDEVEQSTSPRPPDFDDNVPRFTLAELREVLEEKNKLKAKMLELEYEIENMKGVSPLPPAQIEEGDVEDLPVQGPMPREPEDKLYPWKPRKTNTGIRKFFKSFKLLLGTDNNDENSALGLGNMTSSPSFELADSASTPSRTHVKFPP